MQSIQSLRIKKGGVPAAGKSFRAEGSGLDVFWNEPSFAKRRVHQEKAQACGWNSFRAEGSGLDGI